MLDRLQSDLGPWQDLRVGELIFVHRDTAAAGVVVAAALALGVLLARLIFKRRVGRNLVTVPALLASSVTGLSWLRHAPMVIAACGVPFLALALADPLEPMTEREVTYPGRRIAILLDASSSMMVPFAAGGPARPNDAAFLTTVAAADAFVRHRKADQYRDLIALIEFGDEAYVITPFTSDYDSVLLGISLIGDWGEFMRFPDGGTAIGRAIDQGTRLFRAFDFLDAAGNAMVIFSDGQDSQVVSRGTPLSTILASAIQAKIPVYLIRTSRADRAEAIVEDAIWRPAVESTGGRFYSAASEAEVIKAIAEIDRRSAGTIAVKTYSVRQPRFAGPALAAAALWALALTLKVGFRRFAVFP
jgi:hypothetical protein